MTKATDIRASRSLITNDPPDPPQPATLRPARCSPKIDCSMGLLMAYPMPQRIGIPNDRSTLSACSSRTRSQPFSDISRTLPTLPPQDSTDCTSATERAFPCPLLPPSSARRQAIVPDVCGETKGLKYARSAIRLFPPGWTYGDDWIMSETRESHS